jgi:uncharacterized protein YjbJ (UPF0337 family)
MATVQQLSGKWNELTGRLKEKWGNLANDDLSRFEGNLEQLVGFIQQKTGRGREEIEKFIDSVASNSSQMYDKVASAAKEYYSDATDAVRRGYEQASSNLSEGYDRAEDMVRQRPAESLAVIFGAGLISGVLLTLMMRSSSRY